MLQLRELKSLMFKEKEAAALKGGVGLPAGHLCLINLSATARILQSTLIYLISKIQPLHLFFGVICSKNRLDIISMNNAARVL